ncbi:MAG: NAD(P)-dependent oxidoreductase [Hyphomicrobiales bacterium]
MKIKIVSGLKFQKDFYSLPKDKYELVVVKDDTELEEEVKSADALISAFGVKVPDEIMRKSTNLKIISNLGVGVDNINIELARQLGITVTNTPDPVTLPTAELIIGLTLSLQRRICELDHEIRKGNAKFGVMHNWGNSLFNKKIGIIGMGRIGKATASLLQPFNTTISYFQRNKLNQSDESLINATFLPLDELLTSSDIVILCTPLTKDTKHLINKETLDLMKPSSIIINAARGPIINEKDLINTLKSKKIKGAALDVYEFEPEINSDLLLMKNVVLVPHIGTATYETRKEMLQLVCQNIMDFFDGRPLKNIVNII